MLATNQFLSKQWGYEEILANNELYCGKLLHVKPGYQCSLHSHPIKDESFSVITGFVILEVDKVEHYLYSDIPQTIRLKPSTKHRFKNPGKEWATIVEISTPHSDDDVIRDEPSRKINA